MGRVTRTEAWSRRASGITQEAGDRSSVFWEAAREFDPDVDDESRLAGARAGHLAQLFEAAGLRDVEEARSR